MVDEIDPETGAPVVLPAALRARLISLQDVLTVLSGERDVEASSFCDQTIREEWSINVVCVSPVARNRANLTLACLREVYSGWPSVINSLGVVYDDRDQDRKAYAPAFHFRDIPRPARQSLRWEDEPYDYVFAIGGMSNEQGAPLYHTSKLLA